MSDVPRKVYLATAGEYSDYRVLKAFTTSDDAWAYPLGDDVLELDVHDGPVEVRMWSELWWWPHEPDSEDDGFNSGNPSEEHTQKDFDGRPKWVEHRWSHNHRGQSVLVVEGWDVQAVRKVYSEQRAQHIARQDMGITPGGGGPCAEHDVHEWACVPHPQNGELTHVERARPGLRVDFTGSSLHGAHDPLPRPLSEHCRPGRCLGLTCCSYECSQGRCPSLPKEPTP